jgi:hypothetical protein
LFSFALRSTTGGALRELMSFHRCKKLGAVKVHLVAIDAISTEENEADTLDFHLTICERKPRVPQVNEAVFHRDDLSLSPNPGWILGEQSSEIAQHGNAAL